MKYHFRFSPVIILILSTLGFSRTVYLQENFSNPTFPPTGWSIWQVGSATWQRAEESSNGYARGSATMDSVTHLRTVEFSMASSIDILHIRFNNRNYFTGPPASYLQWRVYLFYGSQMEDSWILSSTGPSWTDRDLTANHGFGGIYHVEWWLNATFNFDTSVAYFDVDDVEIVTCSLQDVEPTSLGNIKAAFH
jgi:hypothetical protein